VYKITGSELKAKEYTLHHFVSSTKAGGVLIPLFPKCKTCHKITSVLFISN
jgi:hypothetical protein